MGMSPSVDACVFRESESVQENRLSSASSHVQPIVPVVPSILPVNGPRNPSMRDVARTTNGHGAHSASPKATPLANLVRGSSFHLSEQDRGVSGKYSFVSNGNRATHNKTSIASNANGKTSYVSNGHRATHGKNSIASNGHKRAGSKNSFVSDRESGSSYFRGEETRDLRMLWIWLGFVLLAILWRLEMPAVGATLLLVVLVHGMYGMFGSRVPYHVPAKNGACTGRRRNSNVRFSGSDQLIGADGTKERRVSTSSSLSDGSDLGTLAASALDCQDIPGENENEIPNFRHKFMLLRRRCAHLRAIYPADQNEDGGFCDVSLVRFLVACHGSVSKAAKMLEGYGKWREENYPTGVHWREWIPEISGDNAGLMMIDFVDNLGRPVVVVRGRFRQKGRPLSQTRRLCVGMIDAAREVARSVQDRYLDANGKPLNPLCQYSVILDLGDFGYKNADLEGLLEAGTILFGYFPESLTSVWFIHSNFIFQAMWSVCKMVLPVGNLKKYVFLRDDEYTKFFPTIISPQVLHRRYGGLADDLPTDFLGRYRAPGAPERLSQNTASQLTNQ